MREVKFRGLRRDGKGWYYGSLIQATNTSFLVNGVIDWNEEYIAIEEWVSVIPETVGQFTGLKDCKGKEIYDGDIYKSNGGTYQISIKGGAVCGGAIGSDDCVPMQWETHYEDGGDIEYKDFCSQIEVINNIHEL